MYHVAYLDHSGILNKIFPLRRNSAFALLCVDAWLFALCRTQLRLDLSLSHRSLAGVNFLESSRCGEECAVVRNFIAPLQNSVRI